MDARTGGTMNKRRTDVKQKRAIGCKNNQHKPTHPRDSSPLSARSLVTSSLQFYAVDVVVNILLYLFRRGSSPYYSSGDIALRNYLPRAVESH